MENLPSRPKNYLALAIISTVACCMPLGIVSIIYATKVNTAYAEGNYDLAEKSSKNAKKWGIASIIVVSVIFVLYLIAMVIIGAAGGFDA
jgi:NADH:ubiquinone oxidoreductase subunit 3 (subunit A)